MINSDVTLFQPKSQNLFLNDITKKMNIMMIDDDNRDIALFELLLQNVYNFKFSLLKYNNANYAFDYLQKPNLINLIIIDLYMPEINGNLMIKKLKNNINTKNIPIIVYSSISSCMNVVEASNLETIAFFQKPLQTEHFLNFLGYKHLSNLI